MNRAALERSSRLVASWYPIDDRFLVARVLGNMKLVVDSRDMSLTPHLVMDGFWESWISVWAMAQCRPTSRMLNIGANCGYYTMLFARSMAQVVAVEPQPLLAKCIRLSAELNGLGSKVRVEQVVAGAQSREVELQMHSHMCGSAFVGDAEGEEWVGSLKVNEVPAHELMPDATCAFIDAEGYEPQIWQGLKPLLDKKQLRWVALEWAPSRYDDPDGFLRSLSAYGKLTVVKERGQECSADPATLLRGTEWDTLVVRAR